MIGFWGVPKLRNLALEPPGLGMRYFVKQSIKKMIGFWGGGVPKLRNLLLEQPRRIQANGRIGTIILYTYA